jgi:O-antigen/teichoic acid export membrane protein
VTDSRDRGPTLAGRIAAPLGRLPTRVRWSFVDQALISGVNALTGIILVRSLGLHAFGVFSMVLIGIQFLGVPQASAIFAPMMSHFDQRGSISRSSYLAAMLLHQAAYSAVVVVLAAVAYLVVGPDAGVNFVLVAAVTIANQFQDLSRRFFYVTERPFLALASDVIAYGARFAALLAFAYMGSLTIDLVWLIMIVTSLAAIVLWIPDLSRIDLSWEPIKAVTRSHRKTATWLLGSSLAAVFSDNSFVMLVIGAVLGPAALGAARAVQTIVQVINVLHQSLENFVPSAATNRLMEGGTPALMRYVANVSLIGAAGIAAVIGTLLIFADPIMLFVYGTSFEDQRALILAFGTYSVLAHIGFVMIAGLRALDAARAVFVPQVVLSATSMVFAIYTVNVWGVVGALYALLVLRALFTAYLTISLRQRAKTHA